MGRYVIYKKCLKRDNGSLMCLPKTKGRSSAAQAMAPSTRKLLEKYFYPENLKVQNQIQFDFSWLKS